MEAVGLGTDPDVPPVRNWQVDLLRYAMKPTVIMYGNCHFDNLRWVIPQAPQFREEMEFIMHSNWMHEERGPSYEDEISRCVKFIYQIGWIDCPFLDRLSPQCEIFRIPLTTMQPVWPSHIKFMWPEGEKYPIGRFPMRDRIAMRVFEKLRTAGAAYQEYMNLNMVDETDLGRVLELCEERGREIDSQGDFALNRYVYDTIRSQRLFCDHVHPTGALVAFTADLIFDFLGVRGQMMPVTAALAGSLIYDFQPPVHPQIATFLGIEWAKPDLGYQLWAEGMLSFHKHMRAFFDHLAARMASQATG